MSNYQETMGHFFLNSCRKHPKENFIRHANGETLNYEQSLRRVAATVKLFQELGFKKGDRVVCYWEETLPAIFFTLACAVTGVIPIPLSPVFSVHYLKNLACQSGARQVFTTLDRLGQLEEGDLDPICFANGTFASTPTNLLPMGLEPGITFEEGLEILQDAVASIQAQDVFMIQTTSGSTGQPKLVVRPHMAPLRYAHYVGREIFHEDGSRPSFLVVAALTHALGFHMFTTALAMDAELVIPNRIDARAALEEVQILNPSVLPMTPRVLRSFFIQYRRMLKEDEAPRNLFGSNAKFLLVAGGTADPEFYRAAKDQGLRVIEFYGSTEASLISLTPRDDWREGYSGKRAPDVELKLAEDGEILVRSPGLMLGYYNDEKMTREAYSEDGFFQTGDLGEVDEAGYVQILGRKRDVFNTPEGSNIYPERVENLIESLPWVRQAILVGDRMPYISALIVLNEEKLAQLPGIDASGDCLDAKKFSALYERAGMDLKMVNSQLERVDQVVRFALYKDAFPQEVYATLGVAKVRRDRKKVHASYKEKIEWFYHPTKELDLTFVPGVDRRLRPQTDLKAHLVWEIKDQKKMLMGEVRKTVKNILWQICRDIDVEVLTGELAADHVHLFVAYPATLSINELVQKLKGKSSTRIFQNFPQLKNGSWERHVWGRGYYAVSSGSITDEMIENYIAAQKIQVRKLQSIRKAS